VTLDTQSGGDLARGVNFAHVTLSVPHRQRIQVETSCLRNGGRGIRIEATAQQHYRAHNA
jgi:hypothetical protein